VYVFLLLTSFLFDTVKRVEMRDFSALTLVYTFNMISYKIFWNNECLVAYDKDMGLQGGIQV